MPRGRGAHRFTTRRLGEIFLGGALAADTRMATRTSARKLKAKNGETDKKDLRKHLSGAVKTEGSTGWYGRGCKRWRAAASDG